MHKMATPSARRRLGALLHAAADPDSGVTHIATTAIETVLRSDDEDTITKAMFDAADQMAANGKPLILDPPAPTTPARQPRDDPDDDESLLILAAGYEYRRLCRLLMDLGVPHDLESLAVLLEDEPEKLAFLHEVCGGPTRNVSGVR